MPPENHERTALRQLLGEHDLEGGLIQAEALHTQRTFIGNCRSRGPRNVLLTVRVNKKTLHRQICQSPMLVEPLNER
jgi:hypothetical protein